MFSTHQSLLHHHLRSFPFRILLICALFPPHSSFASHVHVLMIPEILSGRTQFKLPQRLRVRAEPSRQMAFFVHETAKKSDSTTDVVTCRLVVSWKTAPPFGMSGANFESMAPSAATLNPPMRSVTKSGTDKQTCRLGIAFYSFAESVTVGDSLRRRGETIRLHTTIIGSCHCHAVSGRKLTSDD